VFFLDHPTSPPAIITATSNGARPPFTALFENFTDQEFPLLDFFDFVKMKNCTFVSARVCILLKIRNF